MIAPGTIIGSRYRVVRTVGGGGMKVVYLAEDLRLAARLCALAEMIDGFTSPEAQRDAVAAFEREADMLAQLSNEHIPRVIDRFSEANHHYLVMEYVDGRTLEDVLKDHGGKLAPDYVIDVALQILETLEYLHGLPQPVIYRDVKPSNVMIAADNRVKLVDFGIARFFAPLSNATMIGTQGYAPPEQYRGKVEARSDLYALGATMHHALSGRDPAAEPPFSFPPLGKLVPAIDPGLAAIVDQALAYDVARRIPDAAGFRRRLTDFRNPSGAASTPPRSTNTAPTKTQLSLPLGSDEARPAETASRIEATTPAPQASASAPTAVIANPAIRCPNCARTIPTDSRFCSYCAASLRPAEGDGSTPNDATVVLSPSRESRISSPPRPEPRRHRGHYPRRLRGGPRRSALLIALIFLGGYLVMGELYSVIHDASLPGYGNGGGGPVAPVAPEAPALAPLVSLRLMALREALDAQGYSAVHFQLHGNTLVLSGTIPSEDDRGIVRLYCMRFAGIFSLRDNLQVADEGDAG